MKISKTGIKELTARYRDILRKCAYLNAIILMGALASTEAKAEQLVIESDYETTGVTFNQSTANDDGGAIFVNAEGKTVNISDAHFTNNSVTGSGATGGAISVRRGTVNIDNTEFKGNNAPYSGAIFTYSTGNTLNITNSTFEDNTALGAGAVQAMFNTTIEDTTFKNNTASTDTDGGGALFVGAVGKATLDNVTFDSNGADYRGGAVSTRSADLADNSAAKLDILNSTFLKNTAGTTGGALDNYLYSSKADDTAIYIEGSSFTENTAVQGGGLYNHGEEDKAGNVASMKIIDSDFSKNTASEQGGAIYNAGYAGMTISGGTYDQNTATKQGGAIFNYGTAIVDDATFTGNKTTSLNWPSQGGAIFNSGDDDYLDVPSISMVISNTTFGNENDSSKGNQALQGGAIANESSLIDGEVTLNNVNFYNNKAFADTNDSDGYISSLGGAIWNQGIITANGDTTFKGNTAEGYNVEGGAIYNSGSLTFNDTVTFDTNTATDINSGNGAFGGALSNSYTAETVFKDLATFTGNKAISESNKGTQGGAVYNANTVDFQKGASFANNEATYGGAIFNDGGVTTITDGTFTDNTAGDEGGAVFNYDGTVNIKAQNKNVIFSGNKANGQANDITNYFGTINLNAAEGKTVSLAGGIDGVDGTLNLTGPGIVDVSTIKNQTATVEAGELHVSSGTADGSNLAGSSITINNGAVVNTIDELINDYSAQITLKDGASVKGDVDFINGTADQYASVQGSTIKYALGNLINGTVGKGEKDIQVASNGTTIDISQAEFTSDSGATFVSSGAADGKMKVKGFAGGLDTAAQESGNTASTHYQLTEDETLDTDRDIKNNFVTEGAGVGDTDSGVELNAELGVDEGASLTFRNVKLTGTGELHNKVGATTRVYDSRIGVIVNNEGEYYSDPTIYVAKVINSGTATFEDDSFQDITGTALTNNNGVVNLNAVNEDILFSNNTNDVAQTGGVLNLSAESGRSITFSSAVTNDAASQVNLLKGTTAFSGGISGGNLTLASGTNFTGNLTGGSVDLRNGTIDSITGTTTGSTLYLDANMKGTATIDTLGSGSTGVIQAINLTASEYGTADSISLDVGSATLADDLAITGAMNYYTKVEKDGDNVVFSDKLVNQSMMEAKTDLTSVDSAKENKAKVDVDANNKTVTMKLQTSTDSGVSWTDGNGITISNTGVAITGNTTVDGNEVLTTASTLDGSKLADASVAKSALETSVQNSLTLADTAVQNITTGTTNGTISVDGSDVAVYGLGSAAFANTTDFDAAGAAATALSDAKAYTDTKVAAETDRAKGVEGNLSDLSTTDKTTLVAAINENVTAIATETARATAVEEGLDTRLTTAEGTISSHTSSIAANASAIAAETTRATGVEAGLNTRLTTAESNISTNASAIAAETARATGVEEGLDTRLTTAEGTISSHTTSIAANASAIAAEVARATGVENGLNTRLTSAEGTISSHTTSIAANASAIAAETARATGVEEGLNTRLTSAEGTISSHTTSIAANASAIAAETARATGVEEGLDTRLTTAEGTISSHTTSIAANASAIAAETERATGVEDGLNTRLTSAEGTISSHTTSIAANASAIAAETARATGVEDGLNTRLTSAEGTISSQATSIAANASAIAAETERATGVEDGLNTRLTSAEGTISSHTSAIAANATAISDETARATGVEDGLNTRLTTAEGNISTNATAIATETTRATGVEEGLNTRLTTAEGTISSHTTSIAANTSAIDVLNGEGEGSVKKALADAKGYTDTREEAITNAYSAAIDTATLMDETGYNFGNGEGVVSAVKSIDKKVGDMAAIGNREGSHLSPASNTAALTDDSIAGNLDSLDAAVVANDQAILEIQNALGDQSQFGKSRYLDNTMTSADAMMSLDRNLNKLDRRVHQMEKEMKGGFASVAALSALAPNARASGNTQIALGAGLYRDHQGLAIGAYHYFNDNILANIGGAYGGDKSAMLRAGVTFGW
ncbi:MAG: YadA-like family protein [Alphaproteobacteria bacterium]|nr:YadA-like family protein [Alphaproteobacteria bacterium]